MYPEAKALRDSGFESVKVVQQIVKTYIRFRFEDTNDHDAYAVTGMYRRRRDGANRVEIIIGISPDILWPLLLPTFSKSEKFVCSATIASVILHELAVRLVPHEDLARAKLSYADHGLALRKGCCSYHDRTRELAHRPCLG